MFLHVFLHFPLSGLYIHDGSFEHRVGSVYLYTHFSVQVPFVHWHIVACAQSMEFVVSEHFWVHLLFSTSHLQPGVVAHELATMVV